MFEGKAACGAFEQRLNSDVVLPAVSKTRPQLSEVCDTDVGPEQAQSGRKQAQHDPRGTESADEDDSQDSPVDSTAADEVTEPVEEDEALTT